MAKKTKIAVFGASREPATPRIFGLSWSSKEKVLAEKLGAEFGGRFGNHIEILTGACIGVPDLVANEARRYGVRITGYSGTTTLQEHLDNPNYASPDNFDELKFLEPDEIRLNGLIERSLEMIKDADALVYLGGRTGTLGEFAMAYDGSDKPMYILLGANGEIDRFLAKGMRKQRKQGKIELATEPIKLVSQIGYDFNIDGFRAKQPVRVIPKNATVSPIGWTAFAYPNPAERIELAH
jgi:predicted Rossmann-fold nucleotide-binding protein